MDADVRIKKNKETKTKNKKKISETKAVHCWNDVGFFWGGGEGGDGTDPKINGEVS
jgi:hypothetical protein